MSEVYGHELILDLHGCNVAVFTRRWLQVFMHELCERIGMTPEDLHFWDDQGLPEEDCQTEAHTKGTSAVQFILTSSIVIHTLDLLGAVYVNVFSCKVFDAEAAEQFCKAFFEAAACRSHFIERI